MTIDRVNSRWRLAGAAAVKLAALTGLPAGEAAADATLGPLVRVSPPRSPFVACRADNVAGQEAAQGSTNYPNTEIEPWLEVNPANALNLIAGWQQDRWSNGGARGNAGAYSLDNGLSWTTFTLPELTKCTGGPWTRASDPWIAISPNGTAYFMSLVIDDPAPPTGGFGLNGMVVSRSVDGGRSWGTPITLRRDGNPQVLNDKNSMTADPRDSRFAYAVWDRLRDFTVQPPAVTPGTLSKGRLKRDNQHVAGLLRGAGSAQARAQAQEPLPPTFEGPTWFARTTDGGESWETAREIYDPGVNNQTINNIVVARAGGGLINFFTEIRNLSATEATIELRFQRSDNRGASFYPRKDGFLVSPINSFGMFTPDELFAVRDGSILFDVAIDRSNGDLYAVWQDFRFRPFVVEGFTLGDEVAFSKSSDGGRTWSTPVRINQTPASPANPFRQQAFLPSVEVARNGSLVVTYYDFRNDRSVTPAELADHWAVVCRAGEDCTARASWGEEARIIDRSFDYADAPVANGLFLGDYMGLDAGGGIFPLFGVSPRLDGADLYTRRITLPALVTAAAGG